MNERADSDLGDEHITRAAALKIVRDKLDECNTWSRWDAASALSEVESEIAAAGAVEDVIPPSSKGDFRGDWEQRNWPDASGLYADNAPRTHRQELFGEVERLRALLSWIEGACVDELPYGEIRAAIDRYRDRVTPPTAPASDINLLRADLLALAATDASESMGTTSGWWRTEIRAIVRESEAREDAARGVVLPEPPACEHDVTVIYPGTALDVGGYECRKCGERRDSGRMVTDADTSMWWESLDWDGSVLDRSWRGGPFLTWRVLPEPPEA